MKIFPGSSNIIVRGNIKVWLYIFLVLDYNEVSNPPSLSGESSSIFISETELVLINELVEISDFWETSKVNDMDTTLIREIIRWPPPPLLIADFYREVHGFNSKVKGFLKLFSFYRKCIGFEQLKINNGRIREDIFL